MATGAGSGYARIVINAQNNTNTAFQQIQQSLNGLQNSLNNQSGWKSVAAGTAIATAGMAAFSIAIEKVKEAFIQMVSVQREFDKINNALITVTGSAENAAPVFDALVNFAKTSPYDLQQTANAFIRLTDYGLDPSEKALRAYGDMASAKSKDLMLLIEGVADATQNEFIRLREFGIKSKQEGDNVTFTYQNQSKTVKRTAKNISEYILEIASQYSGSSERLSKTLEGQMTALGDTYNQMLLSISQSGVGDVLKSAVSGLSDFLSSITDIFKSGEVNAYLDVIGESFSDLGKTISWISNDFILPILEFTFKVAIPWIFNNFLSGVTFLVSGVMLSFKQMGTFIGQVVANVSTVIDAVVGFAKKAFMVIQNPLSLNNWRDAAKGIGDTISQAQTNLNNNNKIAQKQYSDNYKKFKNDVIATDKAVEAASKKRAEYDKKQSGKTGDPLAKYKPGPIKDLKDDKDSKGAKKAAQEAEKLADVLAKAQIERAKILAKQELDILTQSFNDKKISAQKYYEEKTRLETDALNKEIEAQQSVVDRKKGSERVKAELELFKIEKQREDIIRNNSEEKTKYLNDLKKEIEDIDVTILEKTGQYAKAEALKATQQFKELRQKVLMDGTPEQKSSLFSAEELSAAEAKFAGITKEVELQRQSLELTRQEIENGSKSYSEYYSNLQNDIVKTRDEAIKMYEAMLQSQDVLKNPELTNKIREQVIELKGVKNAGEEAFDKLKDAVNENLEDSINGLLDGTVKLNDAFKSLGKTILQSLSQSLSKNIAGGLSDMIFGKKTEGGGTSGGFDFSSITKLFGGSSGGTSGGFDWSSMAKTASDFFGGFYANGGSVDGRPIMVGEQGPEMFIPRVSGSIIPSSRMNQMGSNGNVVNMTVVTKDAQSFKQNQGKISAGLYRGMSASSRRNS